MNLSSTTWLPVAAFLLTALASPAQAQTAPKAPRYTDYAGENPTADADIKLVSEYMMALVAGNVDKAKLLQAPTFKGYGPAATDSATAAQAIASWQENYKVQSNRKVDFIAATFLVKTGNLRGHWVATWGEYHCTQDGKPLRLAFQYTARVANGKIDQDHIYFDNLYVARALGYKLTPPTASK